MSRREQEQYPVNESDFQHALAAASIVHHPPLSEKERLDLNARLERLGIPGNWKPHSLRSASAASGVSRHRRRASRRSTRRRKMHRRKSHRKKSHRKKPHRKKPHRRKSRKHK